MNYIRKDDYYRCDPYKQSVSEELIILLDYLAELIQQRHKQQRHECRVLIETKHPVKNHPEQTSRVYIISPQVAHALIKGILKEKYYFDRLTYFSDVIFSYSPELIKLEKNRYGSPKQQWHLHIADPRYYDKLGRVLDLLVPTRNSRLERDEEQLQSSSMRPLEPI